MTIQYKLQNNPITKEPCSVGIVGQAISIPMVADNTDYQEYLKWVAKGNEPLPADEGN